MRILADENFPRPILQALREQGHDINSVKETMRGATDREVLEQAQKDERLVVTFDKDFGELAFRFGLPATSGVILFRLSGDGPEADNARALAALARPLEWAGNFAVVTDDRIRIRPLPA
jgi:predicted nuclease of predicted toxin-antitoxin system